MKNIFFAGLLFIFAGFGFAVYGKLSNDKQDELNVVYQKELDDVEKFNVIINGFNKATTKADCVVLITDCVELSKKQQELLMPQINLKLVMFSFAEAEELLDRARGLQASLTVGANEPPKIHPAAAELLEQATLLYSEAKREVDRLNEVNGDTEYNFRLNYIKGEVYYRYLQLFATQDTAKELFNQTVTFYKQALRYKSADTNTVINIELLIKDEYNLTGSAGSSQQKAKLLNQQKVGAGRSGGN